MALLRVPDAIEESREEEESRQWYGDGKMSFGNAAQIYRDKLNVKPI